MNECAYDDEYDYEEQEGNIEGGVGAPKSVGFGPGPGGRPLEPPDILGWLDAQDSSSIRRVMFHCRWLLEQRGEQLENVGFGGDNGTGAAEGAVKKEASGNGKVAQPNEDESAEPDSSWFVGATPGPAPDQVPGVAAAPPMAPDGAQPFGGGPSFRGMAPGPMGPRGGPMPCYNAVGPPMGPTPNKMLRPNFGGPRPPFGFAGGPPGRGAFGPQGPPARPNQMQWTPSGWIQKNNTHKVTSTIKPLPPPDIIPPTSTDHPEAVTDRSKLKMLENNVSMMSFELDKICRKHQINKTQLTPDDMTKHPEEIQGRLKTALGCVKAAEKTLDDFKEYLKDDKYKTWNEEQKRRTEEAMKTMIGEMPQGIPHKKPDADASSGDNEQTAGSDQLAADEKEGI